MGDINAKTTTVKYLESDPTLIVIRSILTTGGSDDFETIFKKLSSQLNFKSEGSIDYVFIKGKTQNYLFPGLSYIKDIKELKGKPEESKIRSLRKLFQESELIKGFSYGKMDCVKVRRSQKEVIFYAYPEKSKFGGYTGGLRQDNLAKEMELFFGQRTVKDGGGKKIKYASSDENSPDSIKWFKQLEVEREEMEVTQSNVDDNSEPAELEEGVYTNEHNYKQGTIIEYINVVYDKHFNQKPPIGDEDYKGICHGLAIYWMTQATKTPPKVRENWYQILDILSKLYKSRDEAAENEYNPNDKKRVDAFVQEVLWYFDPLKYDRYKPAELKDKRYKQNDTAQLIGDEFEEATSINVPFDTEDNTLLISMLRKIDKPGYALNIQTDGHSISCACKEDAVYFYDPNIGPKRIERDNSLYENFADAISSIRHGKLATDNLVFKVFRQKDSGNDENDQSLPDTTSIFAERLKTVKQKEELIKLVKEGLTVACQNGDHKMIKYCIGKRDEVDVNMLLTDSEMTPLFLLINGVSSGGLDDEYIKTVEFLLEKGADVKINGHNELLEMAVSRKLYELVLLLLKKEKYEAKKLVSDAYEYAVNALKNSAEELYRKHIDRGKIAKAAVNEFMDLDLVLVGFNDFLNAHLGLAQQNMYDNTDYNDFITGITIDEILESGKNGIIIDIFKLTRKLLKGDKKQSKENPLNKSNNGKSKLPSKESFDIDNESALFEFDDESLDNESPKQPQSQSFNIDDNNTVFEFDD